MTAPTATTRRTRGTGHVLYYGRDVRTATDAQYQALVVRDRHCRFPGCERRPAWCSAHHVQFWDHGGGTDIDNLVLLCAEHHHRLHDQPGWTNKLLPDGTYEVTWPNGTTRSTRPPRHPAVLTRRRGSSRPTCERQPSQPKLTRAPARASSAFGVARPQLTRRATVRGGNGPRSHCRSGDVESRRTMT